MHDSFSTEDHLAQNLGSLLSEFWPANPRESLLSDNERLNECQLFIRNAYKYLTLPGRWYFHSMQQ